MFNDLFVIVYIPVIIWAILIVILFYFLARKYTFGDWTEENPNPYEGETLAMPRGVLRGILTLSILFLVLLLEVATIRIPNLEDLVNKLLVAFQMVIAFYFGSKVMHHLTSVDEKKSKELTEAIVTKEGQPSHDALSDESAAG
jgi:purine-cytosine permease-like protein